MKNAERSAQVSRLAKSVSLNRSKNRMGLLGAWLLLWFLIWIQPARAFNHPGIPLTKDDLDYVKARLAVQPWKAGWDALLADPHASLSYTIEGPFTLVSRVPMINQNPWKDDMDAVYKLALRGYLAGDESYSAKATTIWEAWAKTMTSYGGNENYLDIGDYAYALFGGPEILRGTYSGWTAQDTTDSINYYNTAIKPALFVPYPVRGANQGMAAIKSALGLAAFCEDTVYWNQVLFAYRNDAGGLLDTAPMGMLGDTGRDQGHSRGQFGHYAWASAVAWAQGVDLFSEQDNRLAKCAEYFSKYNLYEVSPYVTFGSIYGLYPTIGSYSRGFDLPYRSIIQTAYGTRKGMILPWTAQMGAVWGGDANFEFLRLSDTSTAAYSPLTAFPAPATTTTGAWTDGDIGSPGQSGTSSYSNGVWTVKGGGADVYYPNPDQFHFAYTAVSGDFVIVARVLSETNPGTYAKAGLMVRDSLSSTANFADIYMTPTSVEAMVRGALGESHNDLVRTFTQTLPYWVKVERRGEWIGRYCSPDGINWQPVNYAWTTMNAGTTVYVGLMACANDNTKLMTATFDNVAISGTAGPGVAPATPTGLVAASGQGQAMLNWVPGAGATGCNVKRATSNGGPYTTLAANVPAATYTDLDLVNGATYYYVVSGTNSVGESVNSTQVAVTPSASAPVPAAPANLTAFASDGTVDLSWAAVSGAMSYNVKRATTNGGPYTRLFYGQDREITSFSDLDANDGTTSYYVVDAVNAFGESANSNQAAATPQLALVWTGATSGTWNTTATGNWTSNGTAAIYQNSQPVQFDDTAATTSVSPSGTMTPTSVLINNSVTSYSFNTTGIGGTAKVVKRGAGSLSLYASQPFSGGMSLNEACTINFYNGATLGTGVVNVNADTGFWATSNGGNWAGTLTNGFAIAGGATLTYYGDWKVAFNGNFTGAGTAIVTPGYHASYCTLSGSNSGFSGAFNIGGSQPTLLNSVNAGSPNAIWNLTTGGNRLGANVTNGTFYLGEVTNDPGVIGEIFNNVTSANTATFVIGNNNTDDTPVFEGAFVDNGGGRVAVTKVGANTQTLTGANTYTGLTTISAGELIVTSHAAGAGSITVAGSGTLGVANQVDGTSLSVATLTLAAGSALDFSNVESLTTALVSAGSVTVSGTCTLTIADAIYLTNGALYPLIHYSGTFTGDAANFRLQMPAGWGGTIINNANQIALSVTGPAPSQATWGSGVTSGAWSGGSNWGGVAPKNGDYLSFAATSGTASLVNDLAGFIAGSLTFNPGAAAYTISGNLLYLKGDLINNSTSTQTLTLPMVLLRDINVVTNTGAVVLSGEIDRSVVGAWGITKRGAGTGTSSGRVTVAAGGALAPGNAGAGTLTIGGTLALSGGSVLNLELSGTANSDKIALTGGYTASGATTVNLAGLTGLGAGAYPLIIGADGISAANFILGSTPGGPFTYALSAAGGTLSAVVTQIPLPSVPTGLVATATAGVVSLTWAPAPGASAYNLKRSITSGSAYTIIATTSGTSYADTTVANGSTYYYTVSGTNVAGQSANSAQVSATPLDSQQSWRLANFGTIANSGNAADSADPDCDGLTNALEFAAGTNPNDRNSTLKISQMTKSGNDMLVSFPTVTGRTYRLERSDTLAAGSWTNVQDNIAGTGGTVQVTDSGGATQPKRFYRIAVAVLSP